MRLLKIGSSPDCDIVLNSRRVSALHAELIMLNNGDILLEDKGSTNGTFVNNQPIKQGASIPVRRGDLIRFADMELQWSSVPQPSNNSMFKKIYGIGSNMRYNDIQVTGNTVSRFHATLKIDKNGRAFIEDHSMNGTSINGKRIPAHQNVRVKRGDDVVVGGVPVDLKPYIKGDIGGTLLKSLAGIAAVAAVVAFILWLKPNPDGDNPTIEELMHATVMVYGEYRVVATIKTNPYPNIIPSTFVFGYNSIDNDWVLDSNHPAGYFGTAFFISQYGEMGTNRHVARPWDYFVTNSQKISIYTQVKAAVMEAVKQKEKEIKETKEKNKDLLDLLSAVYNVDEDDFFVYENAQNSLLSSSNIDIDGIGTFLGVLRCGQTYSQFDPKRGFEDCQVIAVGGKQNDALGSEEYVDVAMLRLHTPETPSGIKHYSMQTARFDETQLKIGEQLHAWGYPDGADEAFILSNGTQINPFYADLKVSKPPVDYQFEVQGTSQHGSSGSPVFDEKRNLVGVLWGGRGETKSYICNIKYLVEMFDKYNFEKHHR